MNLGRDDEIEDWNAARAVRRKRAAAFSFGRDAFSSNLPETRVTAVKDVQSYLDRISINRINCHSNTLEDLP